jgi:glycosyltransferase involved in cell wall biosynthesis
VPASDAREVDTGEPLHPPDVPWRIAILLNSTGRDPTPPQLTLALGLKSLGHDVKWVSLARRARSREELHRAGIPLHIAWMPSARVPRLLRPLRFIPATILTARLFKNWETQVVISFRYSADVTARISGRLAKVPVIISTIRNERFEHRSREILVRLTDRLATVTTTNSRRVAEDLVARRIVSPKRIAFIPNGLFVAPPNQPSEIRARVRESLGFEEDDFLWLSVGRLAPQKDFASLLVAMRALIEDQPNARLVVAGEGPLRSDLLQQARGLGLQERVGFLGFRDDVVELLTTADAFVLSSRWEGSPKVVAEAGALGLPIVATTVGGVPELVRHGTDALLVSPGDVDGLTSAMRTVMEMPPEKRAGMGESARTFITEAHDPTRVIQMWVALIERHLGRADPRPHGGSEHLAADGEKP